MTTTQASVTRTTQQNIYLDGSYRVTVRTTRTVMIPKDIRITLACFGEREFRVTSVDEREFRVTSVVETLENDRYHVEAFGPRQTGSAKDHSTQKGKRGWLSPYTPPAVLQPYLVGKDLLNGRLEDLV